MSKTVPQMWNFQTHGDLFRYLAAWGLSCGPWDLLLQHMDFLAGFSCGSEGKESACNSGDLGLIPGLGRSSGEGKGYPLQCSGLESFTELHTPWGCKESEVTKQLSLTSVAVAQSLP